MKICVECQTDVKDQDKSCEKCWSIWLMNKTDKYAKIKLFEDNKGTYLTSDFRSGILGFKKTYAGYSIECPECKHEFSYIFSHISYVTEIDSNFKNIHQCQKCNMIHFINLDYFNKQCYIINIPENLKFEFSILYKSAYANIETYICYNFDKESYNYNYILQKSLKHKYTLMHLEEYYKLLKFVGNIDIHSNILQSLYNTAIDDLWQQHIMDTDNYKSVCMKICGHIIDYESYVETLMENRINDHKKIINIYENEYGIMPKNLNRFWRINRVVLDKFEGLSKDTIIMRTLNGQTKKCIYHPNIIVSEFKEYIEKRMKIPKEKQQLIYKGKVLNDNYTFLKCNVEPNSTIHIVLNLSGC